MCHHHQEYNIEIDHSNPQGKLFRRDFILHMIKKVLVDNEKGGRIDDDIAESCEDTKTASLHRSQLEAYANE